MKSVYKFPRGCAQAFRCYVSFGRKIKEIGCISPAGTNKYSIVLLNSFFILF